MIYFCGYPVPDAAVDGESMKPCGRVATPGCAFCDEHGQAFENASEKFGVADSLAGDTGHGRRRLTEDDIVNRAAARDGIGHAEAWIIVLTCICILALYQPVHAWLHAHLELLLGILIGTLAEAAAVAVWWCRR